MATLRVFFPLKACSKPPTQPLSKLKRRLGLGLALRKSTISRCIVSCILVLITQFTLSAVPQIFPATSLLTQLALSGPVLVGVLGLGRLCRRILGVNASAQALVFFNILFIFGVYVCVIRQAVSRSMDILLFAELSLLILGLCRIACSDPGFVLLEPSLLDKESNAPPDINRQGCQVEDGSVAMARIRYCKICKAYIKGLDHHCPAFGSCIGSSNHALFVILLLGFITTEASYMACSSQFIAKYHVMENTRCEVSLSGNLAYSTMTFTFLQVLWQAVFLAWHVYCICSNIKTDEWINWRKYPEFQISVQTRSDHSDIQVKFVNPYDKGILLNLKEFLTAIE